MLTKPEKQYFREELFRHLDGIATAPVAYALHKKKITDYILSKKTVTVTTIAKKFKSNAGYLNVALRILASQGWLSYTIHNTKITVAINEKTAIAFSYFHLYEGVVDLLACSEEFLPRKFELEPFHKLERLLINYQKNKAPFPSKKNQQELIHYQICKHIEGMFVGPIIVHLGMGGMFHTYFMEASFSADEYHKFPESFDAILSFLSTLGWFKKKKKNYTFTHKGLFFAKRASAYGVTVSYLPMFRQMKQLLFGNPTILWNTIHTEETHVDREMNVWGSGGAHTTYFKKIDEIIISLFNKPLEEQPKGILDMGCGNGAFLIHLFDIISSKTVRGKHLDNYPLFLVGADYNKAALKATRTNLIQADIWAKVIWGDIGNPDLLKKNLKENYAISLSDLLSVRTFLDHNRVWSEPKAQLNTPSQSTGAFSYRGRLLLNDSVERNLKDHFTKWKPYIVKFGLIVIELHTIPPEITAQNLGYTAATAYDATHGFSDQYIVEIDSFLKIIKEVGLESDPLYFSKFPNSDIATISINYLTQSNNT